MKPALTLPILAVLAACQAEPLVIDVVRTFEFQISEEVWACKEGQECRRECGGWWPLPGGCSHASDVCGGAVDAADELETLRVEGDRLRVEGLGHDTSVDLGPFTMPSLTVTSTTFDDGQLDVSYEAMGADIAVLAGGNWVGTTTCSTGITGAAHHDSPLCMLCQPRRLHAARHRVRRRDSSAVGRNTENPRAARRTRLWRPLTR